MSVIDSTERRASVHASAEVSAAKHLARTYGFSMRRRRRVGPVIFDLSASGSLYGELLFADHGELLATRIHGVVERYSILQLAELLEYGTLVDAILVNPEPEPVYEQVFESVLTGPIELPEITHEVLEAEIVYNEEPSTDLVRVEDLVAVPGVAPAELYPARTRVIAVPLVVSLPKALVGPEEAPESPRIPEALRLWLRFFVGVALLVQLVIVVLAPAFRAQPTPTAIAMSVAAAIVGFVVTRYALRANDARLEARA